MPQATPESEIREEHAFKLQQSTLVAQMVLLSDQLDLDVCGEMLEDLRKQQTIMPLLDPTRWMREHKADEATYTVMQSALDFARTVRENRNDR